MSTGLALARGDTVYITCVDGEGNACSLINSVYMGFGTGLVVPTTGLALSDMGKYAEAIELYTKAIELDPGYWYAYNHRGLARWSLGDRDAAVRDYEKVAQLMGVEPR